MFLDTMYFYTKCISKPRRNTRHYAKGTYPYSARLASLSFFIQFSSSEYALLNLKEAYVVTLEAHKSKHRSLYSVCGLFRSDLSWNGKCTFPCDVVRHIQLCYHFCSVYHDGLSCTHIRLGLPRILQSIFKGLDRVFLSHSDAFTVLQHINIGKL